MKRVVKVVGRGPRIEPWPEEIHRLLAVEAMARHQGELFDQVPGLLEAPPVLPDTPGRANKYLEATKQPDAYCLRLTTRRLYLAALLSSRRSPRARHPLASSLPALQKKCELGTRNLEVSARATLSPSSYFTLRNPG
jgi:hypothetical protein